jgi:hypothetical protein
MKRIALVALLACVAATSTLAATPAPSSYAGQELRDIKALSTQDAADLQAGKGMGFAKAAELNGYPGPAHVLELASELELSTEQREATKHLFASMQARAIEIGRALLAAEQELDSGFANQSVTAESLASLLHRIGALQAELRGTHLEAHLAEMKVLSSDQVARYSQLRGYGPSKGGDAHTHSGH